MLLEDGQGMLDTKNLSYFSNAEVIVINGNRSRSTDHQIDPTLTGGRSLT